MYSIVHSVTEMRKSDDGRFNERCLAGREKMRSENAMSQNMYSERQQQQKSEIRQNRFRNFF